MGISSAELVIVSTATAFVVLSNALLCKANGVCLGSWGVFISRQNRFAAASPQPIDHLAQKHHSKHWWLGILRDVKKSFAQPHEIQNYWRWLAHPFRYRVCSCKINLHSKGSSQGKILNTESNISMLTERNRVMDGSVLGIPQSGDLDCLGSGIFQAEAEFLVFMCVVEGNPSPLPTRVCFFEYWFPRNLCFFKYLERDFDMIK